jgi:hypothetical protein
MTTELSKFACALAAALVLLVSAGCSDPGNPDNVDRRAVERWNFLIAHQAEKAYDYLTPGFRNTQTREAYAAAMNNRAIQWKSAKFNKKECDAERCKVTIDVAYSVKMLGLDGKSTESSSSQSETWILVDGNWYLLPN